MEREGLLSPGRNGTVKDARGRRVKQLDPVMMFLLRRRKQIDAPTLRGIAKEIGTGLPALALGLFVMFLSSLALALVFLSAEVWRDVAAGRSPFSENVVDGVGGIVGPGLFVLLLLSYSAKQRFAPSRKVMLQRGRCPHCGYDIGGLTPDPEDGATECPECGCAWWRPGSR